MKYLIINADDYGLNTAVNKGILDCFHQGVVTNASLVVYEEASRDAARAAKITGLPCGLHLDLFSDTFPRSHALLGPRGSIRALLLEKQEKNAKDIVLGDEEISLVRKEFERQFQLFHDLFSNPPNHLDYHLGLHFLPQIFEIFIALAREKHVPFRWGRQYAKEPSLRLHPDSWIDSFNGQGLTIQDFFAALDKTGWGVNELSVHPGYQSHDDRDPYRAGRENELNILLSPEVKAKLQSSDFVLTDYSIVK